MAKINIPDREFLDSPTAQPVGPLAIVGSQVAKLGEDFQKAEDLAFISNEVTTRYTNAIKASSEWIDREGSNKNNFSTLSNRYKDFQKKLREETFKDLNDPVARRLLAERFDNYAARQSIAVASHARRQGIIVAKEQTQVNLNNLRDQAIVAKNSDVGDIMKSANELITAQVTAGTLSKPAGEEALKKINGEVQEGRLLTMMRTNPAGALRILKSSKSIPGISPARHLQLQRAARSIVKQNQSVANIELAQAKQDNINSILKTGEGIGGLVAKVYKVSGKREGDKYKKKQDAAIKIWAGNEFINQTSIQEARKFVNKEQKKIKPGRGFTQQSFIVNEHIKALALREKQFRTDRGAFYKNNSSVKAFDEEAKNIVKSAGAIGKFLTSSENPVAQAIGAMFNSSITTDNVNETLKLNKIIALQKADKVDPNSFVLLENTEAKLLVSVYNSTKADKKHEFFAALRQKYGDKYPIVFRDLVRNGLSSEANVINSFATNPNGAQLSLDLSTAIKIGEAKLKENISNPQIKILNSTIDSSLRNYFQSVSVGAVDGGVNLIPFFNSISGSIRKIALVRIKTQGMDATTAARTAADDVINSRYNFVNRSSSFGFITTPRGERRKFIGEGDRRKFKAKIFARIPVKFDTQSVIIFSENKLQELANFKPVPGLKAVAPGSTEATRRKFYIEKTLSNGVWVTNKNDDGLILLDFLDKPVIDKNGNTFGFRFDES